MPRRAITTPTRSDRAGVARRSMLYPLDVLYGRMGVALPVARKLAPSKIPQPYQRLLVHEREMTQTLERYVGGPVAIRVLSTSLAGRWYSRQVLLVGESSGRPAAMGAIRLRLDAFNARTRARILKQQVPLGRVLHEGGVDYLSRPTAFFEVTPNTELMGVFWMSEAATLYGRQTQVWVGGARVGDIVEILPLV